MNGPNPYDVTNMQRFMCGEHMDYNAALLGPDMNVYGTVARKDSHSKELVVMRAREYNDWFSAKVLSVAAPVVAWLPWVRKDEQLGVVSVRDTSVFALTFFITSVIAAILPVVGMVVLAGLEGVEESMGMVAVFNVVVVVCLMVFTEARRKDVFLVVAV
jgi:uncharacterized Tic20 family protein